ncbi:hypothetical protein BC629DRAFT_1735996 [Irpex lacteus]|nr:hypothetical protein BC629DRAFT_1735996 [Irpex lacteus]
MLRWCLSTVRTMGGRRYALSNVARSASTVQLAFQLNGSTGERSATAVQERLPPFASYAGHPSLSLAIALPEEPTLMATVEEGSPTLLTTSTASGGWSSHRLETVQSCCSKQPLVAGPLTPTPPGHHSRADSPSALTKLKQLLSTMTSDAAHTTLPIPTPNVLLSLYHTTKANSQLPKLTPAELSSLTALFGSLSLSTPGRPYSSIYAHPWTARMYNKWSCSTFWPLLIELEADKRDLEQTLCDSDHFWLMHAHLAQDVAKRDIDSAEQRSLAFHSATNHYRAICRTSQPEIHVPFLQMLLKQPSGYVEAASVISELIERFPSMHPSVLDCLWHIVLEGAASLPTSSRSQLLRAFHSRLASNSEDIPAHPTILEEAHAKVPTDVTPLFTTEEVVRALVDVLCGAATRLGSRLRACVTHILATSFRVDPNDEYSIDIAWSNLVLLALANRPSTSTTHNSLHFYPSEWQVICVLAQLERLLHGHDGRQYASAPSSLNTDAVQKIVGSLWTQWLNVKGSESPAPSDLEWAVLGSFLYVAGRTHDERILALCHGYLDDRLTSAFSVGKQPTAIPHQLFAEHISAALLCGSSPMDICHWMARTAEDTSLVVHHVVARIAPTHPILAHELRLTSKDAGISVYEKDVVAIGQQLAYHIYLDYALEYVRDSSLTLSAHTEILEEVLQAFIRSPRDPRYANHWDALSDAVLEILPLDFAGSTRAMVTALLFALLDQGKASHAVPIVMSAIELPNYLLPADLRKIVILLVRHRQFELASSLSERLAKNGEVDRAWYEKVVEEMARGGAHRVASRVAERLPPSSSPSQKMLRATKFRVEAPTTTSTLKVQSILSHSDHDDSSALLGVQVLVSAKRMKAAREFFERGQHHLTPAGRTAVGNALIHGYFMRTPHSIQVALRVLKDLSANHHFVPDRVTMNILVKGLLQWTEKLDKQGVRTLFDRLVLSGYPTGKLYRRGDAPPFNSTTSEAGEQGQEAAMPLPKVTTPISFRKHVRPLYKMFIKGMYVRGDVHGARKVVGILKAAQEDWEERKRKREREQKV